MGSLLQIGELANATGLTVDTIRFYERKRLLRRAARSGGGFRLFSESDLSDLEFIRNAQELGFSLQEIRDLLILKNTQHPDCARVEKMLEGKIASVQAKITALRRLERELTQTMVRCQANLRRAALGKSENCPALTEISRSNGRKKR
ncbi:MAG TPA: MerR family DNA-binding protein [Terriglobales bacterium]|nr:MerR family DNA-binding protein [Acidobacteriaceae bacterium]HKR33169.1 MerR family DNA-binding protein [Terriglobales bacterium]